MTLIDGDRVVTVQLYDDQFEIFKEERMSIIESINRYTDEGITEADVIVRLESEDKKLTNGECIEKIVEQDEDYCVLKSHQTGIVTIQVSLEWWNKSRVESEDEK